MMKILEISTVGNSMTSMAYCLNSTNLTQIEDSHYAIEFDQDKILDLRFIFYFLLFLLIKLGNASIRQSFQT